MGRKKHRGFISIYFQDGLINNRKKRDLTIGMDRDSELYKKCKNMTSEQIKNIINMKSFAELVEKAKNDDRSLGNYIKKKLKYHFNVP